LFVLDLKSKILASLGFCRATAGPLRVACGV